MSDIFDLTVIQAKSFCPYYRSQSFSFQFKALEEKTQRDLEAQYEQEERHVSFSYATLIFLINVGILASNRLLSFIFPMLSPSFNMHIKESLDPNSLPCFSCFSFTFYFWVFG